MTTPEFQLGFLNKIQRLFAEGDFSASYKYALLIAIADIAVESGRDDDQPLVIPHRSLGAKFIDLYWQQSAPFKNNALLIQNNGTQAAVISHIPISEARAMPLQPTQQGLPLALSLSLQRSPA